MFNFKSSKTINLTDLKTKLLPERQDEVYVPTEDGCGL